MEHCYDRNVSFSVSIDLRQRLRDITEPTNFVPKVLLFDKSTEIFIPERTLWTDCNYFIEGPTFYTNGSKMVGSKGTGEYSDIL